jgi:hypothetical protein
MSSAKIRPGTYDQNAARIDRFLRFHNYGTLRLDTRGALRAFQKRNGAPATGNLNYQTCRLLNASRCSHPEIAWSTDDAETQWRSSSFHPVRAASIGNETAQPEIHVDVDVTNHDFDRVHCRWSTTEIRYALLGAIPRGLDQAAWDSVRRAFSTWNSAGVVSLTETDDAKRAEIRVLWTPGPGLDPSSADPFYFYFVTHVDGARCEASL